MENNPVVHIETRDADGNRYVHEFATAYGCSECAKVMSDEFEILIVIYNGFCVYSKLMYGTTLTWGDVADFFS